MISLKELMQVGVENEGVSADTVKSDGSFTLNIDLQHDNVNDFILVNDKHKKYGWGQTDGTKNVLTYKAFRFNDTSEYFQPPYNKNNTKKKVRNVIKSIDKSAMDYDKFVQMIDISIKDFFETCGETNPIIIPLPSTSKLNYLIVDRIRKLRGDDIITYDIFKKMLSDEIEINVERVNRQNNPETREMIYKMWDNIKRSYSGKEFQVKFSTPSMKKFFHFLKFASDDSKDILNKFVKGNVVLVDDTVSSEKNTFNEAIRLLREFSPPKIYCYGFLLDY